MRTSVVFYNDKQKFKVTVVVGRHRGGGSNVKILREFNHVHLTEVGESGVPCKTRDFIRCLRNRSGPHHRHLLRTSEREDVWYEVPTEQGRRGCGHTTHGPSCVEDAKVYAGLQRA